MTLKEQLATAVKDAMRNKETDRLSALRFIQAAVKQKEVDERKDMADAEVLAILDKQAKQRRESIEAYTEANRDDLVAKEQFELDILKEFLPQAASREEIEAIVSEAVKTVSDSGATGNGAIGKVMAIVKPVLTGKADMMLVSKLVKQGLGL